MKWLGCVFLFLVISTIEAKSQPFTTTPPGYGRGGYDERYDERGYDRDRYRYDHPYWHNDHGYQRHRYEHRHCAYVGNVRVCQ